MPYLEDIRVGDRRAFGRYDVTREEVLDFARRYDAQRFHLSDEAAAATHFGSLSASGWHTAAMAMAMNVAAMEPDDHAGLGAAGIDELRWLKPVHPGDVLRCETEVLAVTPSRSKPDIGSARVRTIVLDQDDAPVMRFVAILLYRRRPAA